MEPALTAAGYQGVFAKRPGGRRKDGCATFFRSARFRMVENFTLNFLDEELDENVALLLTLEPVIEE